MPQLRCPTSRRRTGLVLLSAILGLSAGSCGQASQTPLPELTRVSQPLMSAGQQKAAIRRLEEERAKVNAEATKPLN